ncbi:hypothetical protein DRW03_22135 [Corallococcus sp. H22C18031201]|uniref:hypothetical protein n=1 Tax=Citreicoccus inhibens TaxID=2849499 RepID=UPI000E751932|nr:hypothetical protein [Citreicoccus inhibens]MBU8897097.1 hypothetical protein [Citreicoccus inhibens]RJS19716.1 hypothetical protein DRW03_22135 [Corallococcus sp. H22C18031201]
MSALLDALLAFPTAVFTILLGVVLSYWLFVIIGAVGIDVLDGDVHLDVESGAKAVGGALQGGAKAVAGHGHGDVSHSHLDDAEAAAGLFGLLGFSGIPVTVTVSLVVFLSWALSVASGQAVHAALSALPSGLVSVGLGLLCFIAGTLVASVLVRPLRPVFVAKRAPGREELMGRVCIVSSGSVTERFGHGTFEDGGAGLILNIVCAKANTLKRGEPALILAYDAGRDVYEVEPVDWLLPEEAARLGNPSEAQALARARARAR